MTPLRTWTALIRTLCPLAVTIAALVLLTAAASTVGGCRSSAKVENKSTTTGQELQDLEDARNKGLITEDEYQKQREKILKGK